MMQQIEAPAQSANLSVCLFCGSSDAIGEDYLRSASVFGATLAHEGVRLVYGGGGIGLMGAAAKAAHEAGGRVLGVIPEFLCRKEVVYDDVETLVVPNMHERKRIMFEQSDAFAVFPGGIGTLEEAIELMSWRRLDLHHKPIVFLNLAGFWEPLFRLIDHTVERNVTPAWLASTWRVADRTDDVLPLIRTLLEASPVDRSQSVSIRG
jgi:uncharacterized protein (TIGR00730 family)